jgi:hypothetical protein
MLIKDTRGFRVRLLASLALLLQLTGLLTVILRLLNSTLTLT